MYSSFKLISMILLTTFNCSNVWPTMTSRSQTVQFTIDEEVAVNTPLGRLIDSISSTALIDSSSQTIGFAKLFNPSDESRLFNVDTSDGLVSVAQRLDRETLCGDSFRSSPTSRHRNHLDDQGRCRLQFSVNCFTYAAKSSTLGNLDSSNMIGRVELLLDVTVVLIDINDNGCRFVPTNRQLIEVEEESTDDQSIEINHPFDPDDSHELNSVQPAYINIVQAVDSNNEDASDRFKLVTKLESRRLEDDDVKQIGSLLLKLTSPLDFEESENYTLQIVASDGTLGLDHQCRLELVLIVLDRNDHAPVFGQRLHRLNVSENTPLGTPIITLEATDTDRGRNAEIRYELFHIDYQEEVQSLFTLDSKTSVIKVTGQLSHNQKSIHSLDIRASNPIPYINKQPIDKSITRIQINVIDHNDHAPEIRIISPTGHDELSIVEESRSSPLDVALVLVTDNDQGLNSQVDCQLYNQSINEALTLTLLDQERSSGQIRFKLTLQKPTIDREQHQEVKFIIQCWDKGQPQLTSFKRGQIGVIDVNDNAPNCKSFEQSFKVTEDSDPQRAIDDFRIIKYECSDSDEDLNGQLQYRLVNLLQQNDTNFPLTINKQTGLIASNGKLDRESSPVLKVLVIARDLGEPSHSSSTELDIHVVDYNDHKPEFDRKFYDFTVSECQQIGSKIGVIYVNDADEGDNSLLDVDIEERVDLLNQPTHAKRLVNLTVERNDKEFGSDQLIIRLSTASPLDREGLMDSRIDTSWLSNQPDPFPTFTLLATAKDRGSPSLTGFASIRLHIADCNDNPPHFVQPRLGCDECRRVNFSYLEPVGAQITQVVAIDPDAGPNGTVRYVISRQSPTDHQSLIDYINIDSVSGRVTLAKPLPYRMLGRRLFLIDASDLGKPSLTSSLELEILVDESEPLSRDAIGPANWKQWFNSYILLAIGATSFCVAVLLIAALYRFMLVRGSRQSCCTGSRSVKDATPSSSTADATANEIVPVHEDRYRRVEGNKLLEWDQSFANNTSQSAYQIPLQLHHGTFPTNLNPMPSSPFDAVGGGGCIVKQLPLSLNYYTSNSCQLSLPRQSDDLAPSIWTMSSSDKVDSSTPLHWPGLAPLASTSQTIPAPILHFWNPSSLLEHHQNEGMNADYYQSGNILVPLQPSTSNSNRHVGFPTTSTMTRYVGDSPSLRSTDCDSGHGDSLDLINPTKSSVWIKTGYTQHR